MNSVIEILGIEIDKTSINELNFSVKASIENQEKRIIANHNLHSVYLIKKLPEIRAFWEKSCITHIDGMPLIWWGKLMGYNLSNENRITYLDWIYPLLKVANKEKWRIFYLGGKPGVAKKASAKLIEHYPNIIFSEHSGYFNIETSSKENNQVVNKINEFNPNILMVGMGMPRQERWILNNLDNISANVILNSGACFDYIAGEQKTPPRFWGKIGLEWLYRLINDPKRLSKRYLIEPIILTPLFLKDIKMTYFSKSQGPS